MLAVYSLSSALWVILDIGMGLNVALDLVAIPCDLHRLLVDGGSVESVIFGLTFSKCSLL